MRGGRPAALTAALLFAKGGATPKGFIPDHHAAPQIKSAGAGAKSSNGDVRMSLRLDAERHFRLRLAMAHLDRNGRELIVAALDHYLDRVVPGLVQRRCACLEHGAPSGVTGAECCGMAVQVLRPEGLLR